MAAFFFFFLVGNGTNIIGTKEHYMLKEKREERYKSLVLKSSWRVKKQSTLQNNSYQKRKEKKNTTK